MNSKKVIFVNGELKITNDEGRIFYSVCTCGQPMEEGQRLCKQCAIEEQIVTHRKGDVRTVKMFAQVIVFSENGINFFDKRVGSFVPAVRTGDITVLSNE